MSTHASSRTTTRLSSHNEDVSSEGGRGGYPPDHGTPDKLVVSALNTSGQASNVPEFNDESEPVSRRIRTKSRRSDILQESGTEMDGSSVDTNGRNLTNGEPARRCSDDAECTRQTGRRKIQYNDERQHQDKTNMVQDTRDRSAKKCPDSSSDGEEEIFHDSQSELSDVERDEFIECSETPISDESEANTEIQLSEDWDHCDDEVSIRKVRHRKKRQLMRDANAKVDECTNRMAKLHSETIKIPKKTNNPKLIKGKSHFNRLTERTRETGNRKFGHKNQMHLSATHTTSPLNDEAKLPVTALSKTHSRLKATSDCNDNHQERKRISLKSVENRRYLSSDSESEDGSFRRYTESRRCEAPSDRDTSTNKNVRFRESGVETDEHCNGRTRYTNDLDNQDVLDAIAQAVRCNAGTRRINKNSEAIKKIKTRLLMIYIIIRQSGLERFRRKIDTGLIPLISSVLNITNMANKDVIIAVQNGICSQKNTLVILVLKRS